MPYLTGFYIWLALVIVGYFLNVYSFGRIARNVVEVIATFEWFLIFTLTGALWVATIKAGV